jgi:hypothetical protein
MILRILLLSCVLALGCSALIAGGHAVREVEIAVIGGGGMCGGPDQTAGAEWISQPGQMGRLPLKGNRDASAYPWDPSVEGLLLVHMGAQPTGGYGIEPAAPVATVHKAVATIRVNWIEPEPGSMVTQAITAPCLLLKIPKAGIDRIVVTDQHGLVLFEVVTGP